MPDNVQDIRNPLMIGCSGGGGHNAAIQGIYDDLSAHSQGYQFIMYRPKPHEENSDHPSRKEIEKGLSLLHEHWFSGFIRWFTDKILRLPIIPSRSELDNEIKALNSKHTSVEARPYVDMLLDIYPAGYESAGIWNILQRQDKTEMLRRLLSMQYRSDRMNYELVKASILKKLEEANPAYTEIISTQAMALPALCDAVIEYNQKHQSQIIIKQYLTDLPTPGAVHYFSALKTLSSEQRAVMSLHGVGLNAAAMREHNLSDGFKNIEDIQPNANPMVRPGFKAEVDSLHDKWHEDCAVRYKGGNDADAVRDIPANAKVASVMLGSQAGQDTVKYVQALIDAGYDHIFVFGGKSSAINEKIQALMDRNPNRIIPLDNQSDKEMMPIMSRSNSVFIRGGGLSCMEQMAMPHNRHQAVFIHHADSPSNRLTSGISWEDGNVAKLIDFLRNTVGLHAKKTSPSRAFYDLKEAEALVLPEQEQKIVEKRFELMRRLNAYKKRVEGNESNSNKANFEQSFCFFKGSQGYNRQLNYQLAERLLKALENEQPIENLFSAKSIAYSRATFSRRTPGYAFWDCGVQSRELNDIIAYARRPS